ncbi:SPASM domain-containing protein [Alkaliphilus pronyensis]|uniref:SPASM domain-containing protein n=1 Tax=Alkaliphilus pronyensis TaxID=1482732 RepID=A0A6I0EYD1_9FIRM|nr:radical SAM protein [Alkaliphilus pronyensis]KAB3533483.1 SPASM domain-containing protein [Alkaliphilus pronyensis]
MFNENINIKVVSSPIKIIEYDNGMVVFLNPNSLNWVRTSVTGLWIYKYLENKPCSFADLIKTIAENNSLPEKEIYEDVKYFIEDMVKCGFMELELEVLNNEKIKIVKELMEYGLNELWLQITSDGIELYQASKLTEKTSFFPVENLDKLLSEAKALGVSFLTIAGGEPLLHPQFPHILSKARSASNWVIKVKTTASFPNFDYVDEMIKNADIIQVKLDGVKEETHDLVGGKGNFAKVFSLLKYLYHHSDRDKKKIGISFTPLQNNIDEMEYLVEVGYKYKLDFIHLNQVRLPEYYRGMEEDERNELFKKSQDIFFDMVEKNNTIISEVNREGFKKLLIDETFALYYDLLDTAKKQNCEAGITKLCIIENGDVFPCATMKVYPEARVGNCFIEDDLPTLYQKARKWNKDVFSVDNHQQCRECDFRYYCGGGCRARVKATNEPDLMCEMITKYYNNLFKYLEVITQNQDKKEVEVEDGRIQRFFFKHCS